MYLRFSVNVKWKEYKGAPKSSGRAKRMALFTSWPMMLVIGFLVFCIVGGVLNGNITESDSLAYVLGAACAVVTIIIIKFIAYKEFQDIEKMATLEVMAAKGKPVERIRGGKVMGSFLILMALAVGGFGVSQIHFSSVDLNKVSSVEELKGGNLYSVKSMHPVRVYNIDSAGEKYRYSYVARIELADGQNYIIPVSGMEKNEYNYELDNNEILSGYFELMDWNSGSEESMFESYMGYAETEGQISENDKVYSLKCLRYRCSLDENFVMKSINSGVIALWVIAGILLLLSMIAFSIKNRFRMINLTDEEYEMFKEEMNTHEEETKVVFGNSRRYRP